ncbi:MAG: (2Fe-2S)-binding protein [Planctomycetes bacterium]|nr:(2Fe-2S)-binding protein [Planctomycetota bacterium]
MQQDSSPPGQVSRRGFLKGAGAAVAATGVLGAANLPTTPRNTEPATLKADEVVPLRFELNGKQVETKVRTGYTLLETLRDHLDTTGPKLACDYGACGACTVLLDGKAVNSCLVLAVECTGRKVESVEGLAQDGKLHPIQAAFIAEDAMQCGFCTPGMLMSCKGLLDRNPHPSRAETADALAGNICRCGTYFSIFKAVDRVAKAPKEGK